MREAYSANEQQTIGQDAVAVRKSEFDRKAVLLKGKAETGVDRDNALPAYVQARRIRTFVRRQQAATSARLGGGLQASIEQFPAFTQAKAQLEDARRRLRNTSIVASIEGIATQTAPGLRG